MEKVIFHVDVNSAYLSWEAVYRMQILGQEEDLRTIPSAVSGSIAKRHGIILAKSIPAKAYGIKTAETIGDALKKCPNLTLVDPHYDLYEISSRGFMKILREYSPCVEQYSVDEAYMDMTGTEKLHGEYMECANEIRERIVKELGFSVNIGISSNKLLAKMASDFRKPNQVHTLFPGEIEKKMWPLPVGDLFFVGRATQRKLYNLGIHTIGELANTDELVLKKHLKKHGEVIRHFANGRDVSLVENEPPPNKGYGNSITIPFDVCDTSTARMVLLSLCETVCARLRKDNKKASVISVSLKDCMLAGTSRQTSLFTATNITNEIHETAGRLFDELWDGKTPIRQLGVHTTRVLEDDSVRQLEIFHLDGYERYEKLDLAVDEIRNRYGEDSIMRATFLGSPINPMSGGVTREKRRPKNEEVVYQ